MSILNEIEYEVFKYAPKIAGLIGGPIPEVALTLIGSALGVKSSDPQAVLTAVQQNESAKVQLKQLEDALIQAQASMSLQDTENARAKELEEEKLGVWVDMPRIITIMLIFSFIGIIIMIFILDLNPANSTLLGSMVGMLTREFMQACRYYIGGDASQS